MSRMISLKGSGGLPIAEAVCVGLLQAELVAMQTCAQFVDQPAVHAILVIGNVLVELCPGYPYSALRSWWRSLFHAVHLSASCTSCSLVVGCDLLLILLRSSFDAFNALERSVLIYSLQAVGPQSLRGLPNGFPSQQQIPQNRSVSSRLPPTGKMGMDVLQQLELIEEGEYMLMLMSESSK